VIRNPVVWCAWGVATLCAAFMDRDPFLQALLVLVLANTWLPYRRGRGFPLAIAAGLAIIPVLFSVALSRFGRHVLVTLPGIPVIGGSWTWEALIFGASSGIALLLTVAIFAVLSSTLRSADLIALLPRPLYRAGTAFALSLAFAPKCMASFNSIREARQLRGQTTGWRSAPAIIVPVVLTTLEQALQYGESLDARGYGSRRRSRYRPLTWSPLDVLIAAASLIALVLTVAIPAQPYNPYDQLMPSTPAIRSLIALLLLSLPALAAAFPDRKDVADRA
jgi:energy-coupling factor transporter transmembrane protein EcfT